MNKCLIRSRNSKKQTTSGITLVALVVTIVILLILAGVTIYFAVNSGLIGKAEEAKRKSGEGTQNDLASLNNAEYELGKYLNNNFDRSKGVNTPEILTGMSKISFNSEKNVVKQGENGFDENNWYNYENKEWANTMTQDGSMWVWIPRYAYKLDSSTKTADVKFLVGTSNKWYDKTEEKIKELPEGYIVHPCFENGSETGKNNNYENGEWDKDLTGIWVAKFEAAYPSGGNSAPVKASSVKYSQMIAYVAAVEAGTSSDTTTTARNWLDGEYAVKNSDGTYAWKNGQETAIKYPTFQGSSYSMNYININDANNISRVLNEAGNIYGFDGTADSHLMKNSEWGAVTYLCKSQYGLGSTNIHINNVNLNNSTKSVYAVTGCSANGENDSPTASTVSNTWNTAAGQKASTTGNQYGVYDMSGGTWERTASYVANGNGNLKTYGKSVAYDGENLRTTSNKYYTAYTANDSGLTNYDEASKANYEVNTKIYGDAVRETSTAGIGSSSWYGDYSHFPSYGIPFFSRGGHFWAGSGAGVCAFSRSGGTSHYSCGFRAVVVAQ